MLVVCTRCFICMMLRHLSACLCGDVTWVVMLMGGMRYFIEGEYL